MGVSVIAGSIVLIFQSLTGKNMTGTIVTMAILLALSMSTFTVSAHTMAGDLNVDECIKRTIYPGCVRIQLVDMETTCDTNTPLHSHPFSVIKVSMSGRYSINGTLLEVDKPFVIDANQPYESRIPLTEGGCMSTGCTYNSCCGCVGRRLTYIQPGTYQGGAICDAEIDPPEPEIDEDGLYESLKQSIRANNLSQFLEGLGDTSCEKAVYTYYKRFV